MAEQFGEGGRKVAAYSITEVEIIDEDGERRYTEMASAAVAHYGGHFLVPAAEPVVAEGGGWPGWPAGGRVVIIEFPSMDQLRAWYESPEYAPARAMAKTVLDRRLMFVEGTDASD
jgi:uncharacterized protein (DUF1330 family)